MANADNMCREINNLYDGIQPERIQLPEGITLTVDGLTNALELLSKAVGPERFLIEAKLISSCLDKVTSYCLRNGYLHAFSNDDESMANTCFNMLLSMSNVMSGPNATKSKLNEQTSQILKLNSTLEARNQNEYLMHPSKRTKTSSIPLSGNESVLIHKNPGTATLTKTVSTLNVSTTIPSICEEFTNNSVKKNTAFETYQKTNEKSKHANSQNDLTRGKGIENSYKLKNGNFNDKIYLSDSDSDLAEEPKFSKRPAFGKKNIENKICEIKKTQVNDFNKSTEYEDDSYDSEHLFKPSTSKNHKMQKYKSNKNHTSRKLSESYDDDELSDSREALRSNGPNNSAKSKSKRIRMMRSRSLSSSPDKKVKETSKNKKTILDTDTGRAKPKTATKPSKKIANEPSSKKAVNEPSSKKAVNEPPSKKAVSEPSSKKAVNEPSSKKAVNEPSKKAVNEPSKKAVNEPSKKTVNEPSSKKAVTKNNKSKKNQKTKSVKAKEKKVAEPKKDEIVHPINGETSEANTSKFLSRLKQLESSILKGTPDPLTSDKNNKMSRKTSPGNKARHRETKNKSGAVKGRSKKTSNKQVTESRTQKTKKSPVSKSKTTKKIPASKEPIQNSEKKMQSDSESTSNKVQENIKNKKICKTEAENNTKRKIDNAKSPGKNEVKEAERESDIDKTTDNIKEGRDVDPDSFFSSEEDSVFDSEPELGTLSACMNSIKRKIPRQVGTATPPLRIFLSANSGDAHSDILESDGSSFADVPMKLDDKNVVKRMAKANKPKEISQVPVSIKKLVKTPECLKKIINMKNDEDESDIEVSSFSEDN